MMRQLQAVARAQGAASAWIAWRVGVREVDVEVLGRQAEERRGMQTGERQAGGHK